MGKNYNGKFRKKFKIEWLHSIFYLCRFCRFAGGKGRSICRLPAAKETTGKTACIVETGLNRQNGWAKLKSYRHLRAKLKHDLQLGDLKASLINCAEKLIYKTSSNNKIILWCCFWIRPAEQHFTWAKNLLARSTIVIIKANHSSTSSDPSFGSISSICN